MMKGLYTVRDEASGLFMDLQCTANDVVAIRNFDYALAKNDMMNFHPEDFSLWRVGDYDDATGVITPTSVLCVKRGVKKGAKK